MGSRYEAPSIVDLGNVAKLTLGLKDGDATDAAFPAHTKKEDLTFS